jgi:DNA-binding NarL/FixJ family response regulator
VVTIKIILADDQLRVRQGLRIFLEQQFGCCVAGEAERADELVDRVLRGCPDILLLDWGLPGMHEVELIAALRASCPSIYIIVFSGEVGIRERALKAGGDAFVSKSESPEKLLQAIQAAIHLEV